MNFDQRFKGLGKRLKLERNRLKRTQDQFGEALEISKAAVSQWEGGYTVPETKYIAKACDHFGLSADYLLIGSASVRVDAMEKQLLELYRGCGEANKASLLGIANNLFNVDNPGKSTANPFGKEKISSEQ